MWLGNCNTAQACIFLSADRAPSAYSTTRAASIFDLCNLWLPRAGSGLVGGTRAHTSLATITPINHSKWELSRCWPSLLLLGAVMEIY